MSRHAAPRASSPRLSRHGLALILALVVGLGVGVGGAGTYAFWSDRADITTETLRSGSLDLQVDGQAAGLGTPYTKTSITFSGRTPSEYEAYPLTLRNVGNPTGAYTLSVLRGGAWDYQDDAIVVQAFAGAPQDDPTVYPERDTCSGRELGPERLITSADAFTLTAPPRTLTAGASDDLCLRIGIATGAGNLNQSTSGTLVLRAVLTQVT